MPTNTTHCRHCRRRFTRFAAERTPYCSIECRRLAEMVAACERQFAQAGYWGEHA